MVFLAAHKLPIVLVSGDHPLAALSRVLTVAASLDSAHRRQVLQATAVAARGPVVVHGQQLESSPPGIQPTSPTVAGGFLTGRPPGKCIFIFFILSSYRILQNTESSSLCYRIGSS